MDEATKDALAGAFRSYLDRAESADDAAEPAPDLFTLLAELAALKNEVKLESRQVKTALDQFRELFDTLRDTQGRLADEQRLRCDQLRAAERRDGRDLLLELLDLRDRIQAGQDQAARFRPSWLARGRRAPTLIAGLADGMAMNLRRLDEILARRGVRPLKSVGQTFDPHRMHAAELTRDPQRPDGQVVAELRPGWLIDDELLRAAEVVVNRSEE